MKRRKLNLVIEKGNHHFYTEDGERLDYTAGSFVQDDINLWGEKARFRVDMFVSPHVLGADQLTPCTYHEATNTIRTPKGRIIEAEVVNVSRVDGDIESVTIAGFCYLPFETNHIKK